MSISASIDVKLVHNSDTTVVSIIDFLFKNGWEIYMNGKVVYLPFGDDGEYNWIAENITQVDLYKIVRMKEENNEVVGIELSYKGTKIGGELLAFNSNELSFNISINQRFLDTVDSLRIVDVNWYVEKLIACLGSKFVVEQFSFEQFSS